MKNLKTIVHDSLCIFSQVAVYMNCESKYSNGRHVLVSADHLWSLALLFTQNGQALLEINQIHYKMNH